MKTEIAFLKNPTKSTFWRVFLITFVTIVLNSCASFETATSNSNVWIAQEILPSQIKSNGEVFFESALSDGSNISVFQDDIIDIDANHYYNSLYQDFGWSRNGDQFVARANSRRPKRGHLYINPRRRVAIYIYPIEHFSAFKVSITKG